MREPGCDVAGVRTTAEFFFFDTEFELCGDTPAVYLKELVLTWVERASCLLICYNYYCKDRF